MLVNTSITSHRYCVSEAGVGNEENKPRMLSMFLYVPQVGRDGAGIRIQVTSPSPEQFQTFLRGCIEKSYYRLLKSQYLPM